MLDGTKIISSDVHKGPEGFLVVKFPEAPDMTLELTNGLLSTLTQCVLNPKLTRKPAATAHIFLRASIAHDAQSSFGRYG